MDGRRSVSIGDYPNPTPPLTFGWFHPASYVQQDEPKSSRNRSSSPYEGYQHWTRPEGTRHTVDNNPHMGQITSSHYSTIVHDLDLPGRPDKFLICIV